METSFVVFIFHPCDKSLPPLALRLAAAPPQTELLLAVLPLPSPRLLFHDRKSSWTQQQAVLCCHGCQWVWFHWLVWLKLWVSFRFWRQLYERGSKGWFGTSLVEGCGGQRMVFVCFATDVLPKRSQLPRQVSWQSARACPAKSGKLRGGWDKRSVILWRIVVRNGVEVCKVRGHHRLHSHAAHATVRSFRFNWTPCRLFTVCSTGSARPLQWVPSLLEVPMGFKWHLCGVILIDVPIKMPITNES